MCPCEGIGICRTVGFFRFGKHFSCEACRRKGVAACLSNDVAEVDHRIGRDIVNINRERIGHTTIEGTQGCDLISCGIQIEDSRVDFTTYLCTTSEPVVAVDGSIWLRFHFDFSISTHTEPVINKADEVKRRVVFYKWDGITRSSNTACYCVGYGNTVRPLYGAGHVKLCGGYHRVRTVGRRVGPNEVVVVCGAVCFLRCYFQFTSSSGCGSGVTAGLRYNVEEGYYRVGSNVIDNYLCRA